MVKAGLVKWRKLEELCFGGFVQGCILLFDTLMLYAASICPTISGLRIRRFTEEDASSQALGLCTIVFASVWLLRKAVLLFWDGHQLIGWITSHLSTQIKPS